jgi:WD40 repeat protein
LASAGDDHLVILWDAATGRRLLSLPGHAGAVQDLTFADGGRRLISVAADRSVKVWDTATGQETLTLTADKSLLCGVALSPNGRHLATAGGHFNRGEIRIWEAGPARDPAIGNR